MKILIHEPELIWRRGFNGFYGHFLSALVERAGARETDAPRPRPRMAVPREHESCWIRWGDAPVFFDMSDHVQLFDLEALRTCAVYFKANLHRGIARRILSAAGLEGEADKLCSFLFFSEGLADFLRDAARRRRWRMDRPRVDVCFVMGVYENLVRDGARSPFEYPEEPMTPGAYHFWIRRHIGMALRQAGIPGTYRLTSRGHRALEDGENVRSNLSRRAFSRRITSGRMTAVCTLPHAVFPWKASESLALGRPLLIEQAPLTETPPPFRLEPERHYLELLPGTGTFDPRADPQATEGHRVLARIPPGRFEERAAWLRGVLGDRARLADMGEACRRLATRAYEKKTVADYIRAEVERRIG